MTIQAILSVDGGATFEQLSTFPVKPSIGETVQFWHDGREIRFARITQFTYLQTEDRFVMIIQAESSNEP